VRRLILLLVIFAGATASVPELRERVGPRVFPVWDYVVARIGPLVNRALRPAYRWAAKSEASGIARELRQREASGHRLPSPNELPGFIERNRFTLKRGLDPWGTPYFMVVRRDSIFVGSAGPDGIRGTEDDIIAGVARE